MLDAVDGLEIGLHHQPESPRVDYLPLFCGTICWIIGTGAPPVSNQWENLPLGSQASVNPYAAIKDGRAALLNFGFQHQSGPRSSKGIEHSGIPGSTTRERGGSGGSPDNSRGMPGSGPLLMESSVPHMVPSVVVSRGTTGFTCGTIGPISFFRCL